MIRALVLYDEEPDPQRFAEHAALCEQVPGATFRHGRVFAAPRGEPAHKYFAEFEWADMDGFKAGARSDEFLATGKDAIDLGVRFSVEFADLGA